MEREARKTLKKTDRKRETTKSLEKESKMKRMRAMDGEGRKNGETENRDGDRDLQVIEELGREQDA